MFTLKQLFWAAFGLWVLGMMAVVFPVKIRLAKRIGSFEFKDISKAVDEGDSEALWLKRATLVFVLILVFVIAPLGLFAKLSSRKTPAASDTTSLNTAGPVGRPLASSNGKP